MDRPLHVGIVGGSIAGQATAVMLTRQGHEVTVFERSAGLLEERGGGIGLPISLVEVLKGRDLFDHDMRGVRAPVRVWCVKDGDRRLGRVLKVQPMTVEAHQWGLVYRQLLTRAQDADQRHGVEVAHIEPNGDRPTVRLVDDRLESFDVVVGADGYRSPTRADLFPDTVPVYAGYPAWRGIVEEGELPDRGPVQDAMQSPGTSRGHAPFYLVPGRHGETEPGRRRLNWLWYDASAPEGVLDVTRSEDGYLHVEAVAPGDMPAEQLTYLHAAAAEQLPPWHRDVVLQTPRPYMQPIYDLELDHYVAGRVCLVGDAATIARPHTGSGTTKAIQDALALAGAFASAETPEQALGAFDARRAAVGQNLVRLGRRLGAEQVTDVPVWEELDEQGFDEWLDQGAISQVYAFADDEGRGEPRL